MTFTNGKGEIFAAMDWLPPVDGGDELRRVSCSGELFYVDLAQPKCAPWYNDDCVDHAGNAVTG